MPELKSAKQIIGNKVTQAKKRPQFNVHLRMRWIMGEVDGLDAAKEQFLRREHFAILVQSECLTQNQP